MVNILFELGLIVAIAAVLAILSRIIKQPPIIAYILAGVIAGPLFFNILQSVELIELMATLGVALLLFVVGMSLDFRVLKRVGGIALIAGLASMTIIGVLTFLITKQLFNLTQVSSLYLAVAFVFSSTVVVVKLLSDKKELDTLHGKITLGILIIQDIVAAIALMIIPVLGNGSINIVFFQLSKGVLLLIGVFIFAKFMLKGALAVAAKNQETLFLISLAWALVVSISFESLGFSVEIGALVAGISIASSKYSLEIQGKIKGLRDFFIVLFFVFFGSQLAGPITKELIIIASILSTLLLIVKPFAIMTFMKIFGYRKRINFLTGINLAQVSEFSLIILLLGFSLGHIPQQMVSLAILVALITIGISSYIIHYSQPIYKASSRFLSIFDGKKKELGTAVKGKDYEIILLGYNRLGFNLLKAFNRIKKKYLIIDFNPETISELSKRGINCIYGDVKDIEFLNTLRLNKAKMVISTIPDLDINLSALQNIINKNVIFIPTSHDIEDSIKLYKEGADYVIMPHFLGGDFMAHMLVKDNFEKRQIRKEGKRQIRELSERIKEGHKHPKSRER
jgi:Kef-type K+ transport system membrane component KefB/Trk K+ transport system NAD-binding subunit